MPRPPAPHSARPRTGRPRTRRFIKWSATILTVFLLALWLASHIWVFVVDTGSRALPADAEPNRPVADGWIVDIACGAAGIRLRNTWFADRPTQTVQVLHIPEWEGLEFWYWRPGLWEVSGGAVTIIPGLPFDYAIIPLWIPTALALAVALTAWRRDARARRPPHRDRRGLCPRCGYDLTGLTPAAPTSPTSPVPDQPSTPAPAAVICPECGAAS